MTVAVPPPLAIGLPILGNTIDMAKDIIGLCVQQYKLHGPIFRIRALNQEMVVLAGPEANIFITQQGVDKFRSYEAWTAFGQELGADLYIQNADGEMHTQLRKIMKRAYSAGTMLSNLPQLINIAQTAIDRLPAGTEISAVQLFRQIVTEQLGQTLADRAVGADLETMIKFIRMSLNVHVLKTTPALMLRLPEHQRAKQRVMQLGREIIEHHKTTTRDQPDLVDDILAAKEKYPELFGTEGQLLESALGPFVAGLDTVSNECAFMLYSALNHPEVMQQCVEEADHLFANGIPEADQLRSLDVLHHTMMETLRMYSIAPGLPRNAAKSFEFGGYQVKEGQTLFLATTVSHFLPELFADPYKFDITRYSEPRLEHKKRGAFSPFGVGTHICLGAGAAEIQMMLVIAVVLHTLRIESLMPGQKLKIINDPTPTLGAKFRVRIAEHRHRLEIDPA
ncbi:MAG: cytochrome P450 [Chloroflexota bacterium]